MAVLNKRYEAKLEPTSAGDLGFFDPRARLRRYGPLVRVTVERSASSTVASQARLQSGQALIDTGADRTSFDRKAAEAAGLFRAGTGRISSATHHDQAAPQFDGRLRIDGLGRSFDLRRADGLNLRPFGLIALIGRDILEECVLVYNGPDGSFSLSI